MAQVHSSSPFLLREREARILSPNGSHGCFDGTATDSNIDFGSLKKRRLSYEIEEDNDDLHMNECATARHIVKNKRFRTTGTFSFQSGNTTPSNQDIYLSKNAHDLDPLDRPQYSVRHLEQAVHQTRSECNQQLVVKESEFRSTVEGLMRDLNQAQNENRILKRAVNIQNARCKELEVQVKTVQEQEASVTAFAKRVEQENYVLGMRVQQMGQYGGNGSMSFMERRPPDVF